ncbi:MAG: competence/damage-inducible protein A [Actinomycetia bacterium]|nr:competence/damage-inducible protein A [Actinomycetes bacterium]
MNVESLAIGTELLLGQIINSNAAEIATRLADFGMTHRRQTVVGDNASRMEAAIGEAVERSDVLIITGGIGPTQDDITREAVASVAGVDLILDTSYAEEMRTRWEKMGREFPESNLRQAYRPHGARVVPNAKGSAPGFGIEIDGCWVFALPGVPVEMTAMLDDHVVPYLRSLGGADEGVVVSRVLRSWGMSEASVGEMFDDIFHESENPTVAFLASAGVIKIRLTARAVSESEARKLIEPVETTVRDRLGDRIFGVDDDSIEAIIHTMLLRKGWTIATAESATAGLVASRLTGVPGSSATFRGSIGAYAPDIKTSLLGVSESLMRERGIVSEDTALAMARGVRSKLSADVGVAVTGSAGPSPLEVEAGTMCVAVVTPDGERSKTFKMPGDRERVRTYTATAALHHVRLALMGT